MLYEFLTVHRDEIIARTRVKVSARAAPHATLAELEHGVLHFLDQLTETLRSEQFTEMREPNAEIARGAALHGGDLRSGGFTIEKAVHDYGDVCEAVTELVIALDSPVSGDEIKTLIRCCDEAISQAVTEYARQRDASLSDLETRRLGFFAHELRNLLGTAMLAFEILKSGTVGVRGSTAKVVTRRSTWTVS